MLATYFRLQRAIRSARQMGITSTSQASASINNCVVDLTGVLGALPLGIASSYFSKSPTEMSGANVRWGFTIGYRVSGPFGTKGPILLYMRRYYVVVPTNILLYEEVLRSSTDEYIVVLLGYLSFILAGFQPFSGLPACFHKACKALWRDRRARMNEMNEGP